MSSALDQIRHRARSRVPPRPDPLGAAGGEVAPVRLVSLAAIRARAADSRPVHEAHARALEESIEAVGLIAPLTLDAQLTLLAGAHRLSALRALAARLPERFEALFPGGLVPARVMPLDAAADPLSAVRVEVEENEQRLDYSAEEVRRVARDLLARGFTLSQGRPRPGERPLLPALEVVFGKSRATLKRYLAGLKAGGAAGEAAGGAVGGSAGGAAEARRRISRAGAQLARQRALLDAALSSSAEGGEGLSAHLTPEERAAVERARAALEEAARLLSALGGEGGREGEREGESKP